MSDLNEVQTEQLLKDERQPLEARLAVAESIAKDETRSLSVRAKAASWHVYRPQVMEAPEVADMLDLVIAAIPAEPSEFVRNRWTCSLRMAWCYRQLFRRNDVRGYLWQMLNWEWMRTDPAGATNVMRALILCACQEQASGGTRAEEALNAAVITGRTAINMMDLGLCSNSRGFEIVRIARQIYTAIALRPWLGLPHLKAPLKRVSLLEIENRYPWPQALDLVIPAEPGALSEAPVGPPT